MKLDLIQNHTILAMLPQLRGRIGSNNAFTLLSITKVELPAHRSRRVDDGLQQSEPCL